MNPKSPTPGRRWARRLLTVLLVAVSLAFLARQVRSDWASLATADLDPALLPFLLHLAATAAGLGLLALGWHQLLRSLGAPLDRTEAAHAWFVGGLARYVPGKVASLLGRVVLTRRYGASGTVATIALAVEQVLYAVLAVVFLVLASGVRLPASAGAADEVLLVGAAGAALVLFHPAVFRRLTRRALRLLGTEEAALELPVRDLLASSALFLLGWVLYGVGGFLLAHSLVGTPSRNLPQITLAFLGAWAAGFLAFLVPAGLGVREASLVLLLGRIMPAPAALAVAVLSRLTWIGVELLCAALTGLAVRSATAPASEAPE